MIISGAVEMFPSPFLGQNTNYYTHNFTTSNDRKHVTTDKQTDREKIFTTTQKFRTVLSLDNTGCPANKKRKDEVIFWHR